MILLLQIASERQSERVRQMGGTIIEFPANAASRRLGSVEGAPREGTGIVLILPVVRIERHFEETSGGRGPEEGAAAPGRRRRRR
jgi:hypothetical protein